MFIFRFFKRRREEKAKLANQEERIISALSALDFAQNNFDEKAEKFKDQRFALEVITQAKIALGGCVYPGGPAGCSCRGDCDGKWPQYSKQNAQTFTLWEIEDSQ